MVVVGTGAVYLSHLPMFMSPHDHQILLEVSLRKRDGQPATEYSADRKQHPDHKLYTLEPRSFRLSDILTEGASFPGDIFRGHFERFPSKDAKDEARVADDVEIRVDKVLYAKRFDQAPTRPAELEYALFGRGEERFVAHVITAPPDFDQLLKVKLSGPDAPPADNGEAVRIRIVGREDSIADRLRPSQEVQARVAGADGAGEPAFSLVVEDQLYFEEGELSS